MLITFFTLLLCSQGFIFFTWRVTGAVTEKSGSFIPGNEWASDQGFDCRIAIALLVAIIMVARSPATAVAVAQELRAEGSEAKLVMGVTVMSDVVVLVGFALISSLATALCPVPGPDGFETSFDAIAVVIMIGQFAAIAVVGYVTGLLLLFIMWLPFERFRIGKVTIFRSHLKGALIIPLGYLIFQGLRSLSEVSVETTGREFSVEPLMVCMIAASIAGHRSGHNREKFANILDKTAPYIFLPFFTLTGASLELNKVTTALPLAVCIAAIRVFAIFAAVGFGTISAQLWRGLARAGRRCSRCCGCCFRGRGRRCCDDNGQGGRRGGGTGGATGGRRKTKRTGENGDYKSVRSDSNDELMSQASTLAPVQSPRRPLDSPLLEYEPGGESKSPVSMQDLVASPLLLSSFEARPQEPPGGRFRWVWMALTMMSQAGVALGLALETKTRFSRWGDDFATLMLAIVVLNQLIGPPLCKIGLTRLCAAEQKLQNKLLPGLLGTEASATMRSVRHDSVDSAAGGEDEEESVSGGKFHRPVVTLQSPSSYLASAKSMQTRDEESMRHRSAAASSVCEDPGAEEMLEGDAVVNVGGGAKEPARPEYHSPTRHRMLTRSSSAYASLARSPRRTQRSGSGGSGSRSDIVL
jgi:hypothetical protein